MTNPTPADITPETSAAIQGDDVLALIASHRAQEAEIARLKDALEADCDLVTRELAVRTAEFVAMKDRAIKAESALAALQQQADRQADEMTDRHHADQADLAAMTAERDAALAQAAAMREALEGLANVVERDCGVDPCASSMAPAEHYLGLARRALSTEAASNFIVIPRDPPPTDHSPDAVE